MNRRYFLSAASLASTVALLPKSGSAQDADLPNEADIGFCRDMAIHHAQALVMCQRVLGRDTGDLVQAAAAEVLQNQAIEIGYMRAWLADWGESTVPPEVVMGWMGANNGDGMPVGAMPGYATNEELLELSQLSGMARGKRWLELMRAHHVGGVMIATAAVEHCQLTKVIKLAAGQQQVQEYEISQYDVLLSTVYT